METSMTNNGIPHKTMLMKNGTRKAPAKFTASTVRRGNLYLPV